MNELNKDIGQTLRILQTGRITPLAARDRIIACFKAHIEGVPRAENPYTPIGTRSFAINVQSKKLAFSEGIIAQRKATTESLE